MLKQIKNVEIVLRTLPKCVTEKIQIITSVGEKETWSYAEFICLNDKPAQSYVKITVNHNKQGNVLKLQHQFYFGNAWAFTLLIS